jgi:hypothetical protein
MKWIRTKYAYPDEHESVLFVSINENGTYDFNHGVYVGGNEWWSFTAYSFKNTIYDAVDYWMEITLPEVEE